MEDKNNQQGQPNDENQRELDKNKTLDNPASNVVDYGRSEEKAIEQSEQSRQQIMQDDRDNNEGK